MPPSPGARTEAWNTCGAGCPDRRRRDSESARAVWHAHRRSSRWWQPIDGNEEPALPAPGPCLRRDAGGPSFRDRKSTRLNSSHLGISYAVFCLKKKKIIKIIVYMYQEINHS